MVQEDNIEAVIGLGANLFYNSPMEAMILVGNTNKPKERKGKILFVNGKEEVIENKGQAYLTAAHIEKLYRSFVDFTDVPNFCKVATLEEIMEKDGNMNINFYVKGKNTDDVISFPDAIQNWTETSSVLKKSMNNLFEILN